MVFGNKLFEVKWMLKINPHQRLTKEITHACRSAHTHSKLTDAGKNTAERECGIVKGFEAGGCQLFALFIFDLF